ncbi:MAG: PH domain-containing protein, partial [Gemmatimonadaceae bacterium]
IEGVDVEQTVVGRLIGSGVVTVTGTGGSREVYSNVAYPLELRRQVQIQLMQLEEASAVREDVGAGAVPAAREERDCPWCAERILAKARVCKHCGRELQG